MKNTTFGYYAILSLSESDGVTKKVRHFLYSVNQFSELIGNLNVIRPGKTSSIRLAMAVSNAKEDIVYIRGNSYGMLITLLGMIICRIRGKRVILEVATPHKAVMKEIFFSNANIFVKFMKIFALIAAGPWSLAPAHRIVQYGVEGSWFSLFSSKKTILMGNGCRVDSIQQLSSRAKWPSETIKILMVANFSPTHGADILIKALAILNRISDKKYYLSLVGGGNAILNLKKLAKELDQSAFIHFHGSLDGEELMKEYNNAHVAAGALALHRVGLSTASPLKVREYCSVGIPFFYAGVDPDFSGDLSFALSIPSIEDPSEIVRLLQEFSSQSSLPSSEEIRNYAINNLDYKIKITKILADSFSTH